MGARGRRRHRRGDLSEWIPNGFVFDDKLIQRDPRILGDESFWTIFTTPYWLQSTLRATADLYRPLAIASYALNFKLAGLHAPAFHAVNVVLHMATTALVVMLIDAVLRDRSLALVTGLLFAVHPVHTEAVTGVVGRAEVQSALFVMIALYLHARNYRTAGHEMVVWLPVALLSYAAALLSKETAVVAIGLFVLVDVVRRNLHAAQATERAFGMSALGVYAPYVAIVVVYLLVRQSVVGHVLQTSPAKDYYLLFGQPLGVRLVTGMYIFAEYLRLLLVPLKLSADYSYRQIPVIASFESWQPIAGLVATVLLAGAFLWAIRSRA